MFNIKVTILLLTMSLAFVFLFLCAKMMWGKQALFFN